MKGADLDYEDFCEKIEIAPGMTKRAKIHICEPMRSYHYYQSKGLSGSSPFKINFCLKRYNLTRDEYEKEVWGYSSDEDNSKGRKHAIMELIITCCMISFFIGIIGLYYLTIEMAKQRKRSIVLWFIIGIFFTPLVSVLLLLLLGKPIDE